MGGFSLLLLLVVEEALQTQVSISTCLPPSPASFSLHS